MVLNSPGGLDATLPRKHADVTRANFAVGAREVRVKRAGTLVWGGYLWGAGVDLSGPRPTDVKVRAEGYFSRLRHRFVLADLIYNDVAQQTIVRNLIDHTQAQASGDLDIDTTLSGNHSGATVERDKAYCLPEHVGVADAVEELVAFDDGIDLEVGPAPDEPTNKLLKTWHPRKGTDRTATLTIDELEASTVSYSASGDTISSRMLDGRRRWRAQPRRGRPLGRDGALELRVDDGASIPSSPTVSSTSAPTTASTSDSGRFRGSARPSRSTRTSSPGAGSSSGTRSRSSLASVPPAGSASSTQTMRCLSFDVTLQRGGDDADDGIVFYTIGADSVIA